MGGIGVCKAALHWSEWGNGGKEGGKVTAKAFMAEGSIIQNTSEEEHCFHSIVLYFCMGGIGVCKAALHWSVRRRGNKKWQTFAGFILIQTVMNIKQDSIICTGRSNDVMDF